MSANDNTTENTASKVSSDDTSQTRQRKKRRWDQPAESLVQAGVALPGILPLNKIQDELLIARELVINDAEPSVRYRLTKRQTQEEIQKCSGAVVITRGKYRPPNAPPDGEKPLYLHISAGAHIKDTTERILAVDRAAAMVEEMLKQGPCLLPVSSTSQVVTTNGAMALSTCVFLGFDADPSLNIAARIRGPNDQYINHIMNETGATVILRGQGSGNPQSDDEVLRPLHLFLSSTNSKGLEDAKRLAENLLDTISLECGASRASSSKVYGAVPPPQQLLAGVWSSGIEQNVNACSTPGFTSMVSPTLAPPASQVMVSGSASIFPQGIVSQPGGMLNSVQALPNMVRYPQSSLAGGTSYVGYGGIYPQATPLQQVALALRQSPSTVTSTVPPSTSGTTQKMSTDSITEKRPPQKRKFQELPVGSNEPTKLHQGSRLLEPGDRSSSDLGVRNVSNMPEPKKLVPLSSNGMPPPPRPPRTMPPPPPPPKFSSTPVEKFHDKDIVLNKTKPDAVPDTLVKLMEYGDEDDDLEEISEAPRNNNPSAVAAQKPFWAV
ncbi:protein RIK isoform X2 [Tripterygium wilfordii]|uniref:Protein RIK n=1 Tax=Tripterygium wilfordii TaxID=458696 RepID=A0A7J7BUQ1_TRIWF|nr:protein RIK isoform X2 [Tripterygium wilfordii]KAF5725405.1 protein RIK isoform X2 [Tripterygium wilfordii]